VAIPVFDCAIALWTMEKDSVMISSLLLVFSKLARREQQRKIGLLELTRNRGKILEFSSKASLNPISYGRARS
jgi:hypothetical protein